MTTAFVVFILALGLRALVLATLYPHSETDAAKEIDGYSFTPVVLSFVWVMVELATFLWQDALLRNAGGG